MKIRLRETAYLFGGTTKTDASPDPTRVWQLSEDATQWSVYPQNLKTRRLFFRSLVQANTIVHVGGTDEQKLVFWEWDDVTKDFKISESSHTITDWYKYPECFLIGKDDFTNIGL